MGHSGISPIRAGANASPWTQSYIYDDFARLYTNTSTAGTFWYEYQYPNFDQVQTLHYPSGAFSSRALDTIGRLQCVSVYRFGGSTPIDQHNYNYNGGSQRTKHTFASGNYVDYTYDNIGQLKTAKGTEAGGVTNRLHEQFGYAYDAAWNLSSRTNNALVDTFSVNKANELTTVSRSGTLTVAGSFGGPESSALPVTVTVNSQAAIVYGDNTFAKTNVSLTDGLNIITANATDAEGRSSSASVQVNLPASQNYIYDANGNLRTNSITGFTFTIYDYDDENELIRITVPGSWKTDFAYDGLMRRRLRFESKWNGSAWVTNTTVSYVYDGRLPVQERDQNNLPLVAYTRGNDLGGSLQGAGGIGGLLARTDLSTINSQPSTSHAYYHADGNGNISALLNTNDTLVARYSYDPFGNILSKSGALADANLYRFSSKEAHPNSALIYYLYRYYDPNSERWVSCDPLGDIASLQLMASAAAPWTASDGENDLADESAYTAWDAVYLNLHAALRNNPVGSLDPFGLGTICTPAGAEALVIAVGEDEAALTLGAAGARAAVRRIAARAAQGIKKAAETAAKGLKEYNKHRDGVKQALDKLKNAKDALEKAAGKARGPLQKEIENLEKAIKGHLKEMSEKWPNGCPGAE